MTAQKWECSLNSLRLHRGVTLTPCKISRSEAFKIRGGMGSNRAPQAPRTGVLSGGALLSTPVSLLSKGPPWEWHSWTLPFPSFTHSYPGEEEWLNSNGDLGTITSATFFLPPLSDPPGLLLACHKLRNNWLPLRKMGNCYPILPGIGWITVSNPGVQN